MGADPRVLDSRFMTKPPLSISVIFKDWAALLLSYASGGPTVVLALWYIVTGREQQKIGFLAFLGVCAIVAAWVGLYRERRLRILERTRQMPCLKVRDGDFHRFNGTFVDEFNTPMPYPFTSLRLRVENDPEIGTEISQAADVAAKVTFLSEAKDRSFSFEGRWSDTVQPSILSSQRTAAELKTANILIGTTRILDLVLKHNSETVCYGVTNDSYSPANQLLKNPEWMLGPGVHMIRVRFRCANVDQTFELTFRNPEGNCPLEPLSCAEVTSLARD